MMQMYSIKYIARKIYCLNSFKMFVPVRLTTHAFRTSTYFSLISFKKSNINFYRIASFSITPFSHNNNNNNNNNNEDQKESLNRSTDQGTILALPDVSENSIEKSENITNYKYKLNDLGPVVVNKDGSFSIIDNW